MARLKRVRRLLFRRSREERRRLSEGGCGRIPPICEETSEEGEGNNNNTNVDERERISIDDVADAQLYLFTFDDTYSDIMQQEQFAVAEITSICDTKTLMEQNLCNIKKATKSPSSDNLRRIVALTRRMGELEEDRSLQLIVLNEVKLAATSAKAKESKAIQVIEDDVANDLEENNWGGMVGSLFHVLRKG